jgi:uncharacterized membrane protein YvbJ
MSSPDNCPNCGADLPRNARVCPECGSDEKTGWSEYAQRENLGLPDENFDYEDFVKREFGGKKPLPRGQHWFWWIIGVLVVGAILFMFLR